MSVVNATLRNTRRALNSLPAIVKNKEAITSETENDININVIELHLTDICDLKCSYCSYRSGNAVKRDIFPYELIERIIQLRPKAVVLAGGGEPTLYENNKATIATVIERLEKNNIAIGLISNGSRTVGISSLDKLSWLRVSLDAIGENDFFQLKKGRFAKRIKFIKHAMKSKCKHIGIGFLYQNDNIHKLFDVCEYVFTNIPDNRINIQFRPTCKIQSCNCPSMNYSSDEILTSNKEKWWPQVIESLRFKVESVAISDNRLHDFILNQTNFYDVLNNSINDKKAPFRHCYMSLARWIIRSDGHIYPCVVKATNESKAIGNVISDSPLNLKKGMRSYFGLKEGYCNGSMSCCNLVGITNELLEKNILDIPTSEQLITNDNYFFKEKIMTSFPLWPQFDSKSFDDISEILKSGKVNYWTGNKGFTFERKFSEWIGSDYAISCSSGTAAVHIAVSALNIGPGDEVIVPSYTFIATSFAVLQAGAIPVFCDVTMDHTIDPKKIEKLITRRTKAIIVVHLYGVVCDMNAIMKIARKHSLKVIEDSAQCLGGKFQGKKTGIIGDIGTFSFCQSKHFTTGGEGGMVVTNDENLSWECKAFRDHGFDVKKKIDLLTLEEQTFHVHNRIGYNYRMTEIQSAIGINELSRFDEWNMPKRKFFAEIYDNAFRDMPEISAIPYNSEERENAYWLYPLILNNEVFSGDAATVLSELKKIGIPSFKIQWPEAYAEKVYRDLNGFGSVDFPFKSEEYTSPKSVDYKNIICQTARNLLPVTFSLYLHPTWEEAHINECIKGVKSVIRNIYQG